MRVVIFSLLFVTLCGAVHAAEPSGCDKLAWPLAHERELLRSPNKATLSMVDSQTIDPMRSKAVALALVPFADAKLPMTPERAPKTSHSFAGLVHFGAAPFVVQISGAAKDSIALVLTPENYVLQMSA